MKKIVVIGGGTGTYTVLRGLKDYLVDLTAIVSMADDGGSTGRLRDEYGVLPPGDIRRCLVALSESDEIMKELFQYRFGKGGLNGHSFGNLFITALKEIMNDDYNAIKYAGKILNIKGKVLPVTLDNIRLCARLEDGQLITGESNIDVPKHNTNIKIKEIFLSPKAKANPDTLIEINDADLIVIGPGDLYTSIIPNLLVDGISEAIKKSEAKKVYVCNLMTKNGETDNFKVSDFINKIEDYLGGGIIDFVLCNKNDYQKSLLKNYEKEKAYPIYFDSENLKNREKIKFLLKDLSIKEKLIRHDSKKLAREIISLIN